MKWWLWPDELKAEESRDKLAKATEEYENQLSVLEDFEKDDKWSGTGESMDVQWDTLNLSFQTELNGGSEVGDGKYGRVYKTSFRGVTLARKTIELRVFQKAELKLALDEGRITRGLDKHHHIVKIVGSCLENFNTSNWMDGKLHILMFPVANCDLRKFLHDCEEVSAPCKISMSELPSLLEELVALGFHASSSAEDLRLEIQTRLKEMMGCLAEAVGWLHQHDIQHRDLKPANILVRPGQVLLTDFGIARSQIVSGRSTTDYHVGYTPGYAAPEVIASDWQNPRQGDIYSLGCVFLHILTVAFGPNVLVPEMQEHSSRYHPDHAREKCFRDFLKRTADASQEDAAPTHTFLPSRHIEMLSGMMNEDRKQRPSIGSVKAQLRSLSHLGDQYYGPCCSHENRIADEKPESERLRKLKDEGDATNSRAREEAEQKKRWLLEREGIAKEPEAKRIADEKAKSERAALLRSKRREQRRISVEEEHKRIADKNSQKIHQSQIEQKKKEEADHEGALEVKREIERLNAIELKRAEDARRAALKRQQEEASQAEILKKEEDARRITLLKTQAAARQAAILKRKDLRRDVLEEREDDARLSREAAAAPASIEKQRVVDQQRAHAKIQAKLLARILPPPKRAQPTVEAHLTSMNAARNTQQSSALGIAPKNLILPQNLQHTVEYDSSKNTPDAHHPGPRVATADILALYNISPVFEMPTNMLPVDEMAYDSEWNPKGGVVEKDRASTLDVSGSPRRVDGPSLVPSKRPAQRQHWPLAEASMGKDEFPGGIDEPYKDVSEAATQAQKSTPAPSEPIKPQSHTGIPSSEIRDKAKPSTQPAGVLVKDPHTPEKMQHEGAVASLRPVSDVRRPKKDAADKYIQASKPRQSGVYSSTMGYVRTAKPSKELSPVTAEQLLPREQSAAQASIEEEDVESYKAEKKTKPEPKYVVLEDEPSDSSTTAPDRSSHRPVASIIDELSTKKEERKSPLYAFYGPSITERQRGESENDGMSRRTILSQPIELEASPAGSAAKQKAKETQPRVYVEAASSSRTKILSSTDIAVGNNQHATATKDNKEDWPAFDELNAPKEKRSSKPIPSNRAAESRVSLADSLESKRSKSATSKRQSRSKKERAERRRRAREAEKSKSSSSFWGTLFGR